MTLDTCIVINSDGAVIRELDLDEINKLRKAKPGQSGWIDLAAGGGCYMLYNAHSELVKIGFSKGMVSRWNFLEQQGGVPLRPVALWQSETPAKLESFVHNQLADHRRIGEWFDAPAVWSWLDNKRRAFATPKGEALGYVPLKLSDEVSPRKDSAIEAVCVQATITLAELSALTGVHVSTLHRRGVQNKLPVPFVKIGQRWIFPSIPVRNLLGIKEGAA